MILEMNSESEVINQQKQTPEYNVLTGLKFERTHYTPENIDQLISKIDSATMEQFYAYMTTMILNDEEFSSRLDVKDTESFLGIFMLMPEESQVKLVEAMLAAARASNSAGVDALCTYVLTPAMQEITVTPDNLVKLLPIMSMEQTMAALIGYIDQQNPMASIPGLVTLAGEQTMQGIYAQMSEDLLELRVGALLLERLDRRQDRHARADHRGELPRERNDLRLRKLLCAFDLWYVCHEYLTISW